jgi:hypothetical protein
MDKEIYLKLIVLGAVLIVALLSPILSALALTGIVGWAIKDKRIGEIPTVKGLIEIAPPSVKAFFNTK